MNYQPDTPAGRAMKKILSFLLMELQNGLHEVILIPAPDPQHSTHCVRVAQYQNADWYRKFVALHTNCRGRGKRQMKRPRTFISRKYVELALNRMLAGDFSGVYATRLVEFIEFERSNHRHKKRADRDREKNPVDWAAFGINF